MNNNEPIVIVGLGNPGPRYAPTRHNIGFMAVDALAERERTTFTVHKKSGALTATIRLAGRPVTLAKPTTFMNESGRNVGPLMKFFKASPSNLVVLHDELDIDFAAIRLKFGGGEGGHNGLRSISNALGTRDYLRVRLGVGRPPGRQDPADFVLKPFAATEKPDVGLLVENGIDATELLISHGLEAAQNQVHSW